MRVFTDGRVEIDDNVVKRSIRPVVLGRKNALFAGSDGGAAHWAMLATLIETARRNGVEPFARLHGRLFPSPAKPGNGCILGCLPKRKVMEGQSLLQAQYDLDADLGYLIQHLNATGVGRAL